MELRHIIAILWRRRKLLLTVFLLVVALFTVITLLVEPRYQSTAKIYLRKSPAASTLLVNFSLLSSSGTSTFEDTERDTYISLATSSPIMDKVVTDLKLTRARKSMQVIEMIPLMRSLLATMGIELPRKKLLPYELRTKGFLSFFFPRPYVSVEQSEETDILEIKARSRTLEESMAIANGVAQAFITSETDTLRKDLNHLTEVVDKLIPRVFADYQRNQEDLQRYQEQYGILDIDDSATKLMDRVSTLLTAIDDNTLDLVKTESLLQITREQLAVRPEFAKASMQMDRSNVIASLETSLATLYTELAQSKAKYTDKHPTVIEYEQQIKDAKQRIKQEAEKILSSETFSTDSVWSTLTSNVAEYTANLAGYRALDKANRQILADYDRKLHEHPSRATAYARLNAGYEASSTFYATLLKAKAQLQAADLIDLGNVHLLEPATPPEPLSQAKYPKIFTNMALSMVLGVMLALGLSLLVEYLDDSILDLRALTDEMDGVVDLGVIPRFAASARQPKGAKSAAAGPTRVKEVFRGLVARLRQSAAGAGPRRLVVTSAGAGEGKTFVALHLAQTLAAAGTRVLLADGNLRDPKLHIHLERDNGPGLADVLAGSATLEQVILAGVRPGLDVVTAGQTGTDPAGLVDSAALPAFFQAATARYDALVVTSPPLDEVIDAAVYVPLADACLLLAEHGRTDRTAFAAALTAVTSATGATGTTRGTPGPIRFVALNKFENANVAGLVRAMDSPGHLLRRARSRQRPPTV